VSQPPSPFASLTANPRGTQPRRNLTSTALVLTEASNSRRTDNHAYRAVIRE